MKSAPRARHIRLLSFVLACVGRAQAQHVLFEHEGSVQSEHLALVVDGPGDVNGDGLADVLVGTADGANKLGRAWVYAGGDGSVIHEWTGTATYQQLGLNVAGVGDVDGDGHADVLVSSAGDGVTPWGQVSQVRLLSGLDGSVLRTWTSGIVHDGFGAGLAGVGDVNADGTLDVAVGAPAHDSVVEDVGKLYVFSGSDGSLLFDARGEPIPGFFFGVDVDAAGDANGDGYADVLAGAVGEGVSTLLLPGKVSLYSGKEGALLYTVQAEPYALGFGTVVSRTGDLDGDGVDDFAVGARNESVYMLGQGTVRTYSGASGLYLNAFIGTETDENFGSAIDGLGDIDGDGTPELLVGAPGSDQLAVNSGGVWLMAGHSGVTLGALSGNSPAFPTPDYFGQALANCGDTNGDGLDDVVVSAYMDDGGAPDGGRVAVFSISPLSPPGLVSFGLGTPGCDGAHLLSGSASPVLGSADFQLHCDSSPPLAVGLLALSDTPEFAGSDWLGLGVELHVGPPAAFLRLLAMTSDASGVGSVALPIPGKVGIVGVQVYAQAVWPWPATTCVPSGLGASTSRGLAITVLP